MSTSEPSGLDLFADELNPAVVAQIARWRGKPELGQLLNNLRSHTNRKSFFDSYAEAMVARRLLAHGCKFRFEVPTPSGRTADFEVNCGNQRIHLHVKRLDTDRPSRDRDDLTAMAKHLRVLERITQPYIVQVRWVDKLSKAHIKTFVEQARTFLRQARIGDELRVRDHDDGGRELGGVRVIAPWDGDHVHVMISLSSGFVDQAPRFRRLMHRAYQQFMPRSSNVVLICSGHIEDAIDFETALLGSHIERWDRYPPRGKRVAHGRATDGFWSGGHYSESQYAIWSHFAPDDKSWRGRLWIRDGARDDDGAARALRAIFDRENQ